MLVQKTINNKMIESYHYDAAGKLTGAEADIITWEERNTEIYSWLNDALPPFNAQLRPSTRARSVPPDDQGLVQMASSVHRVPALAWSGATASSCIQCYVSCLAGSRWHRNNQCSNTVFENDTCLTKQIPKVCEFRNKTNIQQDRRRTAYAHLSGFVYHVRLYICQCPPVFVTLRPDLAVPLSADLMRHHHHHHHHLFIH